MALHLPLQFPFTSSSSHPQTQFKKSTPNFRKPLNFKKVTKSPQSAIKATSTEEENPINEPQPDQSAKVDDVSDLGTEIRKAMEERDRERGEKGEGGFWGGVAEEVAEIEWPAFSKVVGTTGIVLGVILGSSVVLLTLNAVLAELSDRIFAGRGVQDFFG